MRLVLTAAIALAVLAGPVLAQNQPEKNPLDLQREREKMDREENERAYNETVRRTRTTAPATKADPWRGVRPAETNTKR
jgi:hypothetical protein